MPKVKNTREGPFSSDRIHIDLLVLLVGELHHIVHRLTRALGSREEALVDLRDLLELLDVLGCEQADDLLRHSTQTRILNQHHTSDLYEGRVLALTTHHAAAERRLHDGDDVFVGTLRHELLPPAPETLRNASEERVRRERIPRILNPCIRKAAILRRPRVLTSTLALVTATALEILHHFHRPNIGILNVCQSVFIGLWGKWTFLQGDNLGQPKCQSWEYS